jgi:FG-GAP repeat protein
VRRTPWLQWTASPPTVADLDRDGRNEVIGLPNVERGIPYRTRAYAFMVLDGAQRGGARSARRHRGFVNPPLSGRPTFRPDGDWYPPTGIPAPTVVDIAGDRRLELVAPVPDGFVYAVGPTGRSLWRYDYARGARKTFASEVAAADLNRDGRAELVLGTYGRERGAGRLVVLSATGRRIYDRRLRGQGSNGNGIGAPAAPSIADLDGDGRLEIVLSTFDHGLDVYRVPRSGTNSLPWPTGRGNLLRDGSG